MGLPFLQIRDSCTDDEQQIEAESESNESVHLVQGCGPCPSCPWVRALCTVDAVMRLCSYVSRAQQWGHQEDQEREIEGSVAEHRPRVKC